MMVGREKEILKTIQVLSRRKKNNPCLIGEPGVGKTAIAEGLAQLIHRGDVPESLRDKVIISLDLSNMLAGTKFRGEFEDRLNGVLREVEAAGDRIILFIDEIHVMVGAGGSEGAIDASNILKPPLAKGRLRCLGTTTLDEYRTSIEKDPALARRFQSIYVAEPSPQETELILKGLRAQYELYHRIQIPDATIAAAVKLASVYMTEKRFPDKAIDLIDEASSRLRNRVESKPPALMALEAELAKVKHTLHGLTADTVREESDTEVYEVQQLMQQLEDLTQQRNELHGWWRWRNQQLKEIFEVNRSLHKQQEELRISLKKNERSERQQDLRLAIAEKEARVQQKYQSLQQLAVLSKLDLWGFDPGQTQGVQEGTEALQELNLEQGGCLDRNVLSENEVARVVAEATGIPEAGLQLRENGAEQRRQREELLQMEEALRGRLVGQRHAISTVARAIRLSRAGLRFHDRPLGVFLLLGPTGVGKTELVKAVSEFLFRHDGNDALLRVDMSEYMERFSVSRLVGAPPGYVGYEEGGVLTEAVRRRPFRVILLDELEKAHRDVSNLLLQVFDEGRLTDSQGRTVDFKNTVIFMTSNLGSDALARHAAGEDEEHEEESGVSGPLAALLKQHQEEMRRRSEESGEAPSSAAGTSSASDKNSQSIKRAQSAGRGSKVGSPGTRAGRRELAADLVRRHFSPEFANRLDDIILFDSLDTPALRSIAHLQLGRVQELLRDTHGVQLLESEQVLDQLAQAEAGEEGYGARPLKRRIQNQIMAPLADFLLQEDVRAGDLVFVSTAAHTPTNSALTPDHLMLMAQAGGRWRELQQTSPDIGDEETQDMSFHMPPFRFWVLDSEVE